MKKLFIILLILPLLSVGVVNQDKLKSISVNSLNEYFSNNKTEPIEGFYEFNQSDIDQYFTIAIIKEDNKFKGYIVETNSGYEERIGLKKLELTTTKDSNVFELVYDANTISSYDNLKRIKANFVNESLLNFSWFSPFKVNCTLKKIGNTIKSSVVDGLDLKSESSVRQYFDKNGADGIEGIWEYSAAGEIGNSYRLAILKDDYKYNATVIEKSGRFKAGDLKATFETAASEEVLTINWLMSNKTKRKTIGVVKNNALIEFTLSYPTILYRVYPKFDKNNRQKRAKNGEWAGNGSGVIISKSGHIITNNHVIDDADDIEVEFILDDEVQKFNAEIVQVDKTNDLAIIKIVDVNFDGVANLPFNFKTRSSDVGTKVYAFGYPMALSIMGKEIKVTDGIISSKTGFDGNITTYQITAPIQGGNSGGPLFDDKGNLIGINQAKIRNDIADNVSYSIKTSYVLNLIDILPKSIDLPSSNKLANLPLTEQIKQLTKYVVLVKVK